MSHCHPEAVQALAQVWRLTPEAATRWLDCECQAVNNPTNPLNIRWYGRALQTGRIGGFATYASDRLGFGDGLAMVTALSPHYGYAALLASLGTNDTYRQTRAIELSSWAAGHYGATDSHAGCLSRGLDPKPVPAPSLPEEPMDPTVLPDQVVDCKGGGTLYRLVAGKLTVVSANWGGATNVATYGVQPHGEPPRPITAAPLRALRLDARSGPAEDIYTGYYGNDLCSAPRARS